MIWHAALGDVFGIKPWEVGLCTPDEVQMMNEYLQEMQKAARG